MPGEIKGIHIRKYPKFEIKKFKKYLNKIFAPYRSYTR